GVVHAAEMEVRELCQLFEGGLRRQGGVLAIIITGLGKFCKFEGQPWNDLLYSPQGFDALRHDLLADAITRDDGNLIGRHGLSFSYCPRHNDERFTATQTSRSSALRRTGSCDQYGKALGAAKARTPGHTGSDVGLVGSWFQTEAAGFADHHVAMLPMVYEKCK